MIMIKAKDFVCLFGAITGVASGAVSTIFRNISKPIALEGAFMHNIQQGLFNSLVFSSISVLQCAINGNFSVEAIAIAAAIGFVSGAKKLVFITELQELLFETMLSALQIILCAT